MCSEREIQSLRPPQQHMRKQVWMHTHTHTHTHRETCSKKMHNPTSYFQNGSKIPAKFKLIELQQFVFYQTSTKKAAYHCVRAKQRQSGTEWVSSLRLQSKQIKQTNEILPGMTLIWEIKISNLWERLTLQSDGNLYKETRVHTELCPSTPLVKRVFKFGKSLLCWICLIIKITVKQKNWEILLQFKITVFMWIYSKMSFISVMRSCIFSIITPVFSVTWSSEIIIICWFAA